MTDKIDKLIESISKEYGSLDEENNRVRKRVIPPKEKPLPIHNEKNKKRTDDSKVVRKGARNHSNGDFRRAIEKKQVKASNKKPSAFRKTMKIVFDVLFYTFILILLAGSALFALNGSQQKDFFGFRVYTVKTNSMLTDGSEYKDGFAAGDMIVVKKTSYEKLEIGDIITFIPGKDSKSYLTHRLVEKMDSLNDVEGHFVRTKGDANKVDDSPFSADLITGKKVLTIPKVGPLIVFIRDNFIVSLVFIVSFFGFIFALKYYFSKEEM